MQINAVLHTGIRKTRQMRASDTTICRYCGYYRYYCYYYCKHNYSRTTRIITTSTRNTTTTIKLPLLLFIRHYYRSYCHCPSPSSSSSLRAPPTYSGLSTKTFISFLTGQNNKASMHSKWYIIPVILNSAIVVPLSKSTRKERTPASRIPFVIAATATLVRPVDLYFNVKYYKFIVRIVFFLYLDKCQSRGSYNS